jgi:hypothetical protein
MHDEPDLEDTVPTPIEPEKTEIFARLEDPTTIFDVEEWLEWVGEQPTVRERPRRIAEGSAPFELARVSHAKRVAPIPPRRRAVTQVELDESYEAAMRQFR